MATQCRRGGTERRPGIITARCWRDQAGRAADLFGDDHDVCIRRLSSGSAIGAAASSARAMLVAHMWEANEFGGRHRKFCLPWVGEQLSLRSSRRASGCGVAGGRRRSTCHPNRRREGACSMSAPSAPSPPAAGGANGGAGCDATDHAVEMLKIRELIKSLQATRG